MTSINVSYIYASPIIIGLVTPGTDAREAFWQLFEKLRDRMDLGLAEDKDRPMIIRHKRANLTNSDGNVIRVWQTDLPTLQAAIRTLAAEKALEMAHNPQPAIPQTATPAVAAAGGAEQPAGGHAEKRKKREKPEPSIEEVAHQLRTKKGRSLGESTITRFLAVMSASLARHEDPRDLVRDRKALAKFSVAERKAFQHAVDEVYGQKENAR